MTFYEDDMLPFVLVVIVIIRAALTASVALLDYQRFSQEQGTFSLGKKYTNNSNICIFHRLHITEYQE
jgi:hypothetical protein